MGIEVSVVMPCLNEEETIGQCLEKAFWALKKNKINGEVLVVDNGSTDRSVDIAQALGARVVYEPEKGYGNAYRRGFKEAKGKYIVMGDSDNTYDFLEMEKFLQPLRDGYDLVIGSRLKGKILPGAMTWSHQYIGNPLLSRLMNLLFHTSISDSQCGMRSLTKEAYERLQLKSPGMEFASEMLIKAAKVGLKITEVPIIYYPRGGESKLNSLKDGWRHLRLMLLYAPEYLFLLPGLLFFFIGLIMLIVPLPKILIATVDSLKIMGSLSAILGFQTINLFFLAKTYLTRERSSEDEKKLVLIGRNFSLERGLAVGIGILLGGAVVGGFVFRIPLLAGILMAIGAQAIFTSFFFSLLTLRK